MARPLRIEYPGAIYHITSRGNGRGDIYQNDDDRENFLDVLASVIVRFGWICHSYCLMGNHYHLLIETPEPTLCGGMRQLNGVYTQRYNRSHNHVGHVFQGRYKAIVVDRDVYLLELCRYVVLNPVRAKMVKNVREWIWSSYAAMIGEVAPPSWLSVDWLLSQFGKQRLRSMERYAQFVDGGLSIGSVWSDLNYQIYLGGDDFVDHIKAHVNGEHDLAEVPRAQWKKSPKTLDAYVDEYRGGVCDRQHAMALAFINGGYRMNEIAKRFGVHYTTVSRAVKKIERELHDRKT